MRALVLMSITTTYLVQETAMMPFTAESRTCCCDAKALIRKSVRYLSYLNKAIIVGQKTFRKTTPSRTRKSLIKISEVNLAFLLGRRFGQQYRRSEIPTT